MVMKNSVVIAGDKIYAGIVEDEIVAVNNAIVIEFGSKEDMQEALRNMALAEGFQQGMSFSQSLPPINAELSAAERLLQSIPSEEITQHADAVLANTNPHIKLNLKPSSDDKKHEHGK
jgi:hypothetical protein